jgi:hypothetical protein
MARHNCDKALLKGQNNEIFQKFSYVHQAF